MALFGWWRIALCVVMAIGVWQGWVSFDGPGEEPSETVTTAVVP
jgi:hypothetical protein